MLDKTPPPLRVRLKPNFEPITQAVLDRWNDDSLIQYNHNCYSFALAALGVGWCNLGNVRNDDTKKMMRHEYTEQIVSEALQKDGLKPIEAHGADPKTQHIIACFLNLGWSYHFYRLCDQFGWCAKKGRNLAEHIGVGDIRALAKEDAPEYPHFVGYFVLPEEGIVVARDREFSNRAERRHRKFTFEPA